ncbi:hypothetical protein L6R50_09165 [Myxococcota bacterium]|nr:hypothetical protein [Myxococcota bacterium]
MVPTLCRLSTTSDVKRLAAAVPTTAGTPGTGETVPVLTGEAGGTWPRLVELLGGAPFDALIAWSGGGGKANAVAVSVARSTRVCVIARAVNVSVVNRSSKENEVTVCIADEYATTRNQFEVQVTTGASLVAVPNFAQTLQAVSSLTNTVAVVELINGFGTAKSRHAVSSLSGRFVYVGTADTVNVTGLAAGEIVTLTFGLGV